MALKDTLLLELTDFWSKKDICEPWTIPFPSGGPKYF